MFIIFHTLTPELLEILDDTCSLIESNGYYCIPLDQYGMMDHEIFKEYIYKIIEE